MSRRTHLRALALLLALALAGAPARAQQPAPARAAPAQAGAPASDSLWAPWRALIGSWVADSSAGAPGAASAGGFSFTRELDGRVLVRRDWSTYPATKDHPAFRHEAVMYIYPAAGGFRAMYWDNEDHAIPYTVAFRADEIVLTSDLPAGGPRFRLTHRPQGEGRLYTVFEIAARGQDFRKYIDGMARRVGP